MPVRKPINKLNVLVYPRFEKVPGTQAYDAKWMRSAKRAASNPSHAMVVVLSNGHKPNPAELKLYSGMRKTLGKRLFVVNDERGKPFQERLGKLFSTRGFSVLPNSEVVGMGQHYSKEEDVRMCIDNVSEYVLSGLGATEGHFSIDRSKSLRFPRAVLLEQLMKLNIFKKRGKSLHADMLKFIFEVTPFLENGLVKYSEVLSTAKKKRDLEQAMSAIRDNSEKRLLVILNKRELAPSALDDFLAFTNREGMKTAWRLLIEIKKEKVLRGKLPAEAMK